MKAILKIGCILTCMVIGSALFADGTAVDGSVAILDGVVLFLNQVLSALGTPTGVWGVVFTVISAVLGFLMKYKDRISAIILRVEKESADGWTNEEKEQLAIDLYFQEVYPLIPVYLKWIPKSWQENFIRGAIKKACASAKKLTEAVSKAKKEIAPVPK